jgi:polyisoprenoid-binding protein YceI
VNEDPNAVLNDVQTSAKRSRRKHRWLRWLVVAVATLGIAAVAIPYVYITYIRAPPLPPLSFDNLATTAAAVPGETPTETPTDTPSSTSAADERVWAVVAPSTAGYRVNEILGGQDVTAVGRTSVVEGEITVSGNSVMAAEISVDLASIKSDSGKRDAQFNGRIMNTTEFPVATFTINEPIVLQTVPTATPSTVSVMGTLSLRGVDKPVTLDVVARQVSGEKVELSGSTKIVFADFEIPDPSIGPIRTEDNGLLEFAISLAPA